MAIHTIKTKTAIETPLVGTPIIISYGQTLVSDSFDRDGFLEGSYTDSFSGGMSKSWVVNHTAEPEFAVTNKSDKSLNFTGEGTGRWGVDTGFTSAMVSVRVSDVESLIAIDLLRPSNLTSDSENTVRLHVYENGILSVWLQSTKISENIAYSDGDEITTVVADSMYYVLLNGVIVFQYSLGFEIPSNSTYANLTKYNSDSKAKFRDFKVIYPPKSFFL